MRASSLVSTCGEGEGLAVPDRISGRNSVRRRREANRIAKGAPYAMSDKDAEIRAATSYVPRKSSRNGATIFSMAVFVATCVVVLAVCYVIQGRIGPGAIGVMLVAALMVLSSTHIALSWEKVVVLRLGKVNRVAGPGLYFTIPLIEHGTIRVDQRTIATPLFRRSHADRGFGSCQHRRRAVLDGLGCREGLHGGRGLLRRRVFPGANGVARSGRPIVGRRGGAAA